MQRLQTFFRILGGVSAGIGVYAFYDFGEELSVLLTQIIGDTYDIGYVSMVFSSFFIGAFALIWIGFRLIFLRNFKKIWLFGGAFPPTSWLYELYNIGPIGTLSQDVSFWIAYIGIYGMSTLIMYGVHMYWYERVSHEADRYIGLEKPSTSFIVEFRWAIFLVVLLTFVIFNPIDALRIFNEAVAMIVYVFNWLQG